MSRTVLLLSLLSLAACDQPRAPLDAGDPVPVIIDGADPDRPEHEAVVALHEADGRELERRPFCSGTLIAEDVVLTAAHCTDGFSGPEEVAVYVGDHPEEDARFGDHVYAVEEIAIHADWQPYALRNDISLLRLASAPDETEQRIPALPPSLALTDDDIGTIMNFAGFGYDEDDDFGRKLQVDVPLAGFGCALDDCTKEGDPETQISVEGPAGPCNGDSGGPMFVYRDGVPWVAGVTSYGQRGCGSYKVSTKVDAFSAFVQDFVGEAAPAPPPPAAPGAIVINEIMVDPSGSDWHGEWVELVNTSADPVDLSGWVVADDQEFRHAIFDGTVLAPGEAWVYVASYGLDNRGGDRVLLLEPDRTIHAEVRWTVDARTGISLNRAVDADATTELLFHDEHPEANGAPYSPRTRVDGTPFGE